MQPACWCLDGLKVSLFRNRKSPFADALRSKTWHFLLSRLLLISNSFLGQPSGWDPCQNLPSHDWINSTSWARPDIFPLRKINMGTSKLWHCPKGESGILGRGFTRGPVHFVHKKAPIAAIAVPVCFPFTPLGDRYATAWGTTIKSGRITPQGSIGLILTTTAPRCSGRGWEDSDGCRPKTSYGCTYLLAQFSCLIPSLLSYTQVQTCRHTYMFFLYVTFLLQYVYCNILYMYK